MSLRRLPTRRAKILSDHGRRQHSDLRNQFRGEPAHSSPQLAEPKAWRRRSGGLAMGKLARLFAHSNGTTNISPATHYDKRVEPGGRMAGLRSGVDPDSNGKPFQSITRVAQRTRRQWKPRPRRASGRTCNRARSYTLFDGRRLRQVLGAELVKPVSAALITRLAAPAPLEGRRSAQYRG